jgi:hypothetical protein
VPADRDGIATLIASCDFRARARCCMGRSSALRDALGALPNRAPQP